MTIIDSTQPAPQAPGAVPGAASPAIANADGLLSFSGTIDKILYQSSNSSWGIVLIRPELSLVQALNQARPPAPPSRFREDPSVVKCVGVLASTTPGVKLDITGAWELGGKYGLQFTIKSSRLVEGIIADDASRESVAKLLMSFRGIGPVIASEIVEQFSGASLIPAPGWQRGLVADLNGAGERVGQVCERHSGSQALYESIMLGWKGLASKAGVLAFLYDCGFGSAIAQRIFDWYCEKRQLAGDKVEAMIRENPYRLIDDIVGVGFKMADECALKLGVPIDSLFRKVACLSHCLKEAAQDGHTILLRSEAHNRCMETIGQPMVQLLEPAVEAAMCAEQRALGAEDIGSIEAGEVPQPGYAAVLVLIPSDPDLARKFRIVFAKGVRQFYVGDAHLVDSERLVSDRVKQMIAPVITTVAEDAPLPDHQ